MSVSLKVPRHVIVLHPFVVECMLHADGWGFVQVPVSRNRFCLSETQTS